MVVLSPHPITKVHEHFLKADGAFSDLLHRLCLVHGISALRYYTDLRLGTAARLLPASLVLYDKPKLNHNPFIYICVCVVMH